MASLLVSLFDRPANRSGMQLVRSFDLFSSVVVCLAATGHKTTIAIVTLQEHIPCTRHVALLRPSGTTSQTCSVLLRNFCCGVFNLLHHLHSSHS